MDKDKEIARLTDIAIAKAEQNDEFYKTLSNVKLAFAYSYKNGLLTDWQFIAMDEVHDLLAKIEKEGNHEHNSN